ncbi:MAG TPA: SOS response-associated peptidase [Pirellulales bacterium]|nr:SOS response-associated peptidase [Pirellulales bacterium]
MAKNRGASAQQVVDGLKAEGVTVTVGLVHNVKARKKAARAAAKAAAPAAKRAAAPASSSPGSTKADAIRDVAKGMEKPVRPRDVIAALKAQGVKASSAQVSTVLRGMGMRRRRRRKSAAGGPATAVAANSAGLNIDDLVAAKKLVGEVGSRRRSRRRWWPWPGSANGARSIYQFEIASSRNRRRFGMISMCGRFTLRTPAGLVAEAFGMLPFSGLQPRYNIAPSQPVAVVRLAQNDGRELAFLKWGLVPSWADDPAIGYKMINARGETVATKPSFRKAFKVRRCLVVADGFYEWQKTNGGGKKQPHYIRLKDDVPFAFAGLWEHWVREGQEIDSCTIITTDANELMAPIHDRMPVIMAPADYELWLDPAVQEVERLQPLLRPFAAGEMKAYPVSTMVNNPRTESENCVEALA